MSSMLSFMLFASIGIAAPPSEAALAAMQDEPTVQDSSAVDPATIFDTGPEGPGPFTFCAFAADVPNEGRYAIHSSIRHASEPRPTEADFRAWAETEAYLPIGEGSNPRLQCLTFATFAMADAATMLGPEEGGPELPPQFLMHWPPFYDEEEGHDTYDYTTADDLIARAMEAADTIADDD